ncbi:MAG: PKD domain-containing protein [Halobacteriales archaeon SW_8_66_22]|nr:MAG: PKD domain-containing protein [Halobacteriales archaeon SW_8_66_22]
MSQMSRRQALQLLAVAGGLSVAGESATAGARSDAMTNSVAATQTTKLPASDGAPKEYFGSAVAIEGDRALIGAEGDAPDTRDTEDNGAAYTFERSDGSWSQQTKRKGGANENFGSAVALDGDTALIGLHSAKGLIGRARLYEWASGSLNLREKFTPEHFTPSLSARFGNSVALDGDTLLIGAPREWGDPPVVKAGAAYVFERSNDEWNRTRLVADDRTEDEYFGRAVAVSGDTAFVGVPFSETSNGYKAGSVYVFERSGGSWSQAAKLTADDGDINDSFGESLALEGSTILIGSGGDSPYVFERSDGNWSQQAKLTATDRDEDDAFGSDVALDGTTALIGDSFDADPNGPLAGSAYVFEKSDGNWSQQTKLSADDGDPNDEFGYSVALSGDTALVGAFLDEDPHGLKAGSAYVFDLSEGSEGDGPGPVVGGDPPTDPDGDGLYEDIDGDGEFTIGDVQLFFQYRDSDAIQDNAEFFNFSRGEPAEVTIADVQELFQELSNTDE